MALAIVLPWFFVRLALLRLQGPLTPERRAQWLQACCRSVLNAIQIEVKLHGTPPSRGLVVSNHLSYLDIAVYASLMPCAFVSKMEVADWPYFGAAARAGGTIFLDRASRASAAEASATMEARLAGRVPVLLFPEGTSTDGTKVLRFHSTLFAPAIAANAPVTPAAIRYRDGAAPESELCWYGDEEFLPNLWKLLGKKGIAAEVNFGTARIYDDRRTAALASHDAVETMRTTVCVA